MNVKRIFGCVLVAVSLFACSPDEGKGGLASIEGKVMIQNINALFEKSGKPYVAVDEDVYISYGSTDYVDDKESTSSAGVFKFSNLTKGEYTVYVYSDDTISNVKNPKIAFSQKVSLEGKKDEAQLSDFIIYKHVDYDDGNGVVKGNVKLLNYLASTYTYSVAAQEESVYLQFENDDEILERYRTDALGNFKIGNLIPGKYKLFVYSDSRIPSASYGDSIQVRHFEIIDNSSEVVLDTLTIKSYK
ncbi:MAG: hypothetical protein J6W37_09595 [Bacteroidales bacterium]|jgi:hypothetical protein|nr:hypothetical protein [Bacteroidales bacterium]